MIAKFVEGETLYFMQATRPINQDALLITVYRYTWPKGEPQENCYAEYGKLTKQGIIWTRYSGYEVLEPFIQIDGLTEMRIIEVSRLHDLMAGLTSLSSIGMIELPDANNNAPWLNHGFVRDPLKPRLCLECGNVKEIHE